MIEDFKEVIVKYNVVPVEDYIPLFYVDLFHYSQYSKRAERWKKSDIFVGRRFKNMWASYKGSVNSWSKDQLSYIIGYTLKGGHWEIMAYYDNQGNNIISEI